jgi:hypothetical protein
MGKQIPSGFSLLLAATGLLWAGPGAAETGCLLNDGSKVCLDLNSDPADNVQPSEQGGTPTYVKFIAELRNVTSKSTRFVTVNLALNPGTLETVAFTADPALNCTRTGATATCSADKVSAGEPMKVTWTVEAPTQEGVMGATGDFGWNGRTTSVSTGLAVAGDSGRTHVPANTEGTTVTTAEPSADQVTADAPLYAAITLPSKPYDYSAKVTVITNGPAQSCTGGLFLSATDGGPYVCRTDIPTRWIEVDIDLPAGHEADPFQYGFSMQWDASIISELQLPPTPVAPTGTPPFAVFYSENSALPPPMRAFSADCATNAPPCLTGVQVLANGDWEASGQKLSDNPNVVAANSPMAPFLAVLDFLINAAQAAPIGIDPPDIMK